jgi:hypothetical protein
MKNSFFSLLPCLFVALCTFVGFNIADAQTFKVDGPKTYNFTSQSYVVIILKNLTPVNQKVFARIENNTDFQVEYTPKTITLLDSSFPNGSELDITYSPHGPSIIHAQVILFDSVSTRDTIFINGKDTLYHDALHPFRIFSAAFTEMVGGTQDPSRYIRFKHGEGTWELPLTLRNYSQAPLNMKAEFIGSPSGYSVSPATLTLATYPANDAWQITKVSYQKTGNQFDTAMLVISSSIPSAPLDTFVIIGTDSTYKPYPVIRGDTVDFGWLHPGTEDFFTLYLQNPYPKQTISIMENVKDSNNGPGFGITTMHFYPFTIGAGKKDSVLVSFKAPEEQGIVSVVHTGFKYAKPDFTLDTMHFVFIGRTRGCYPLEPKGKLTMESTIPGGYTDAAVIINNPYNTPITITSATPLLGSGYFSVFFSLRSPALPMTIPAFSKAQLTFRFAPEQLLAADATSLVTITVDSTAAQEGCSELVYSLQSSVISPDDTSEILLYPDQTVSLPMASEADTLTKRFTFKNNLDIAVKVMTVSIGSSGHFAITGVNPSPLPVTLQPNATITVDVRFDAGNNGFYTDSLVIVTDHSLISQSFHLKALRTNGLPSAVNTTSEARPFLRISPNPASAGIVTCSSSAGTKAISIFDALGNLVAQKEHSAQWVWSGISAVGLSASSGVYFVRAEGVDNAGRPFVISKKLIIDR